VRTFRSATALFLDLLVQVCATSIVFVFVTGGGVYRVSGIDISVRTTGNVVTFACVLLCLRAILFSDIPFFPLRGITVRDLCEKALRLARWVQAGALRPGTVGVVVSGLVVASVTLRLANAGLHPGFLTGDDVELHEMTFQRLFGTSYQAWTLRSPLYPFLFLFPAQRLAVLLGVTDPEVLVFVGRAVVVILATLAILLIYRLVLRWSDNGVIALLASVLFATSRLHLWFGSTELPRPISAVFVLLAAHLLSSRGTTRAVVAGACLGFGGALRFGELVFFAPALVHLSLEKRWRDAVLLVTTGVLAAGLALGIADWSYWGGPFYSLMNVVDYTVVKGLSSRGYQPFHHYLTAATEWTNHAVLLGALASFLLADRRIALWVWIPIVILSCLPHKEARYLVAVQPFAVAAAAMAALEVMSRVRRQHPKWERLAAAVVVAGVCISVMYELSNWRLRRTDSSVALAQAVAAQSPTGICTNQLWAFGGRIYWSRVPELIESPLSSASELQAVLQKSSVDWLILPRERANDSVLSALGSGNFIEKRLAASDQYRTFRRTPGQSAGLDGVHKEYPDTGMSAYTFKPTSSSFVPGCGGPSVSRMSPRLRSN
jgi:hypothetical protein